MCNYFNKCFQDMIEKEVILGEDTEDDIQEDEQGEDTQDVEDIRGSQDIEEDIEVDVNTDVQEQVEESLVESEVMVVEELNDLSDAAENKSVNTADKKKKSEVDTNVPQDVCTNKIQYCATRVVYSI